MILKLASGKNTDPSDKEEYGASDFLAGLPLAGLGAGAISTQAPLLKALKGRADYYHATGDMESARSIGRSGLNTNYAGKERRLNSLLMRNNLFETAMKHIPKLETDKAMQGRFIKALTSEKVNKADNYGAALVQATQEFAQKETGAKLPVSEIRKSLRDRGKRTYVGGAPEQVLQWDGRNGSEARQGATRLMNAHRDSMDDVVGSGSKRRFSRKALRKGRERAYITGNTLTGGGLGVVKNDVLPRVRAAKDLRKAPKVDIDLKNMGDQKDLFKKLVDAGVDYDQAKRAVYEGTPVFRATFGDHQIKTLGSFKDFPGVAPIASFGGGFRDTLEKAMPHLYSAGRDISTAGNTGDNQLKELQLWDPETGKPLVRLKNTRFKAPKAATLLSRLKGGAKPLAISTLGAGLIYRGVTGKNPVVQMQDMLQGKEKTASVLTRKALKAALGAGAVGGGMGLVGAAVYRPELKALNYTNDESLSLTDRLGREAEVAGLDVAGRLIPLAVGGAGVRIAGGPKAIGADPVKGAVATGALAGSGAGATGAALGSIPVPMIATQAVDKEKAANGGTYAEAERRILDDTAAYLKHIATPAALGAAALLAYPAYKAVRHYPFELGVAREALLDKAKDGIQALRSTEEGAQAGKYLVRGMAAGAVGTPLALYGAGKLKAIPYERERKKREKREQHDA